MLLPSLDNGLLYHLVLRYDRIYMGLETSQLRILHALAPRVPLPIASYTPQITRWPRNEPMSANFEPY